MLAFVRGLSADKSIEIGNLSPLREMISKDKLPELTKRFDKVMSLKNFDVNNVKSGREYIEAYVQFFKFAEGEEELLLFQITSWYSLHK